MIQSIFYVKNHIPADFLKRHAKHKQQIKTQPDLRAHKRLEWIYMGAEDTHTHFFFDISARLVWID
jgi:hypothetical protein